MPRRGIERWPFDRPPVLRRAPRTVERFDAARCTTFDGRALAVVRPAGVGAIEVAVTADGLDPATVSLEAPAG